MHQGFVHVEQPNSPDPLLTGPPPTWKTVVRWPLQMLSSCLPDGQASNAAPLLLVYSARIADSMPACTRLKKLFDRASIGVTELSEHLGVRGGDRFDQPAR